MRLNIPAITFCFLSIAAASGKETTGVDLALLSANTVIAPGETFTVALKVKHDPGFHTYWENPGLAGVPVTVEWALPEGFTAGPLRRPVPERTFMAVYPVHGYKRDVMLLADVRAPEKLPAGKITLKAEVAWMACGQGCYPGQKDLSLTVETGAQAVKDGALAEAFRKAEAEIPVPLQGWTVTLDSAADEPEIRLHFTPVEALSPAPEGIYFFSSDGQITSGPAQTATVSADGSFQITARRSEYSPKGKSTLPGVLVTSTRFGINGPSFASIQPAYRGQAAATASAVESAPSVRPPACECEKEGK